MYYIKDYEQHPRKWISGVILGFGVVVTVVGSYLWIIDWLAWYVLPTLAVFVMFVGFLIFLQSYLLTKRIFEELDNHREYQSKHEYSLSLKYQLEENLWCEKVIKNGLITLVLVNTSTAICFIPAKSHWVRENYGEEFTQLFDCLYNIFIAANVPTLGFGAIWYNDYLHSLLRTILCGRKVQKATVDEAHVYFTELEQQWGASLEKGRKPKMKKRRRREDRHDHIWYLCLIKRLAGSLFLSRKRSLHLDIQYLAVYVLPLLGLISTVFGLLLIKNDLIILALLNITILICVIPANSSWFLERYGRGFTQLCDCLYNLFIAANGPTLGFGTIWYNDYLRDLLGSVLCASARENIQIEEGQVYFIQLQQQWESPFEKKNGKSKRSL